MKWGVGTILETPLERRYTGSLASHFFPLVLESMSAPLKTSWRPGEVPEAITYRKYTLDTLESHCEVLVPAGVRCEWKVVVTGAGGLFVSGSPPWCAFTVLPQASVWRFSSLTHVWINVI